MNDQVTTIASHACVLRVIKQSPVIDPELPDKVIMHHSVKIYLSFTHS